MNNNYKPYKYSDLPPILYDKHTNAENLLDWRNAVADKQVDGQISIFADRKLYSYFLQSIMQEGVSIIPQSVDSGENIGVMVWENNEPIFTIHVIPDFSVK